MKKKNINWKKQSIPIKKLSLWDENARFPEEYFNKPEEELVEYFLKRRDFKLENFAKEVVVEFDLPQLEKLVVLKLGNKNIVLEGNRRLAAYKLLANPFLTKKDSARKLFGEWKNVVKIDDSYKLECVVTTIKGEGLRFLERKHNKGNNEVGWEEPERRNFAVRRSHGSAKDVLRVDLVNKVKELHLPESIKEAVLGRGLVTTFFRIVDSAPARLKLGYEILENGHVDIKDREKFDGFLKVVVFNIWAKKDREGRDVNSRTLNKSSSIEDYIKSLQKKDISKVNKEIQKSTEENLFGEKILTPSRIRSGQLSVLRKNLINTPIYVRNPRVNEIYDELRKKLDVDLTPNAVAVLFRVFIEVSVDCYIEENNIKVARDITLGGKILKVVDHLENSLALGLLYDEGIKKPTDSEVKKAKNRVKFVEARRLATKDNNSVLSVSTFNTFVHDYKVSPIPSELKRYWDNLGGFFVVLWESISRKR